MRPHLRMLIIAASLLVLVPASRAQQEAGAPAGGQETPAAPGGGELPAPAEERAKVIPDNRLLSGAEELKAESPSGSRNYVVPSLRLSAFGDSNRTISETGERGVEMTGSVVGSLALQHVTRKNRFVLDYMGGGYLYARNSELNAMMHQLGFAETIQGRRWGLTIADRSSYLPESSFGFGGFGSSLIPSGGLGGWNPTFTAGQTLFTGRGPRITNSVLTQLQYIASSRSSFTASASYGLLRFRESGYIESDFGTASVGYNYSVSRRDTLALTYGLSLFRYEGVDYHLDAHFAQLAYSRRLTGRWAFQMSAGPQMIQSRTPASGSVNRASWTAHSSLDYNVSRTHVNFTYGHYTSNGSGLLLGASTDSFRGFVQVRLTRNWGWSINPGYSRNSRLAQSPGATGSLAYNSIHVSSGFHRNLGRYTDLSFHYSSHEQWSSATNPSGINTGSSYLRHTFGISMSWHPERVVWD